MTHFIGAVVVPPTVTGFKTQPTKYPTLYGENALEVVPGPELTAYLEEALEPYSENLEVPAYIEADEDWEKELAEAKSFYAEHAGKPDGRGTYPSLSDLESWSDQRYLDGWSGAGAWKPRENGVGFDKWTTYNPQSKWDWWTIGGRWEEQYRELQGQAIGHLKERIRSVIAANEDEAEVAKLAAAQEAWKPLEWAYGPEQKAEREAAWEALKSCAAFIPWSFPYSIVHPVQDEDGGVRSEWTQKGRMGWFGMSSDEYTDLDWAKQLLAVLDTLPDEAALFYVDFHI